MSRSFRAEDADGTIGVALARLGEPLSAVNDGRVFVERRRARSAETVVRGGDEIVVHAPAEDAEDVRILGEWQDLYAVSKPPGLSTEPDRKGGASLVRSLATQLDVPVSVLHAATRLDAPVSGIVVVARGNDAALRVATLQQEGLLSRRYVALASRPVTPEAGAWNGPIGKGEKGKPSLGGKDARPATTLYRTVARTPPISPSPSSSLALLVLEPGTGRPHQLRVHAAAAGSPLVGDVLRGAPRRIVRSDGRVLQMDRIALHAARIEVRSGEYVEWSVRASPPPDIVEFFADLGGDRGAFDVALDLPWLDAMPRS